MPSSIWPRPCSSEEVQRRSSLEGRVEIRELKEAARRANSLEITAHGVESIECSFHVEAAKEVSGILLVHIEGDAGDVLAVFWLLPS